MNVIWLVGCVITLIQPDKQRRVAIEEQGLHHPK